MVTMVLKIAAVPEAAVTEAAPPSRALILSSRTALVGLPSRVYMLPNSLRAKRFDACSALLNTKDVVRLIGTPRERVAGSGDWPAWTAEVSKPCFTVSDMMDSRTLVLASAYAGPSGIGPGSRAEPLLARRPR